MIELAQHQKEAIEKLRSGSILCGGTGSGKSIAALAYYLKSECEGSYKNLKPLYIITTARKRDTHEWEEECHKFKIMNAVIDSWNNIHKYISIVGNAFFIFDEQRVIGSGAWVKSFLAIAGNHNWILLTATPGDTWSDYIPAFIANGFYRNRTEFLRRHAVFLPYSKYPKIERYVDIIHLEKLRRSITVLMPFERTTTRHQKNIILPYDEISYNQVMKDRWNVYKDQPIKDIAELCYTLRKVVNSDERRLDAILELLEKHSKVIIFYNFDYELDILRRLHLVTTVGEWNGHIHEPLPDTDSWVYLVQYAAGGEGWNCIQTDTMIFYSMNYSHRMMEQAAGRIDRLNTPFRDLYYYRLRTNSQIDKSILKALNEKRTFNENHFIVFEPRR